MSPRRKQPLIADVNSDTREGVCLRVAAAYLNLDERTVRARIEDGRLEAWRDGAWCVTLASLRTYDRRRRQRLAS